MTELYKIYNTIRSNIDKRLNEFKTLYETGSHKDIFKEMSFCTCTPQNDAKKAWDAVCHLDSDGTLLHGDAGSIAKILRDRGVRFHQNKARYIVINRNNFYPNTKKMITDILNDNVSCSPNMAEYQTIVAARNLLEKKVTGWGLKEASHFLRNIGFGSGISILDRHILRQLAEYNVIKEIPQTLTKKTYWQIENMMLDFSNKEKIPLDAMDLLFWYKEKNELFK
ncbi:MAG: N-glycosylase/DNA lyase [Termitinemataceae bacterium]|nr:MAG: N-glycosylase/DNA lyase [Termitinemataceae bacterium]